MNQVDSSTAQLERDLNDLMGVETTVDDPSTDTTDDAEDQA